MQLETFYPTNRTIWPTKSKRRFFSVWPTTPSRVSKEDIDRVRKYAVSLKCARPGVLIRNAQKPGICHLIPLEASTINSPIVEICIVRTGKEAALQ